MDRPQIARPALFITFDIFGTVLDWRSGLETACRDAGRPLEAGEFERLIDAQATLEQGPFLDYATITRLSLSDVLGFPDAAAVRIAKTVGDWPLYPDAAAVETLMTIAPCAAMTNSDRAHGLAIQDHLGFQLDDWLSAEEARVYKPDPVFWRLMAARRRIAPGPDWWHVSAYADYDLDVANALGLTTVFVRRPHARPGPASHEVPDLSTLVALVRRAASEGTSGLDPDHRSRQAT